MQILKFSGEAHWLDSTNDWCAKYTRFCTLFDSVQVIIWSTDTAFL